ncbi:MAG TPA: hypothetical protein VGL53_26085 [Bryobacteraceae bacterium]|jgi:hypothetical protein
MKTLAFLVPCALLLAQAPPASIAGHPDWPKANPNDVKSIDAIVAATYDVISGPKGTPRDWNRFRSLFVPDGRLAPTVASPDGHADVRVLSVDQYAERASGNFQKNGFFERGISQKVESFGNIVHVFTTYESRHSPDDPTPFTRGINSFQLLKDGDRYWVVSIYWDSERPGSTIPAKYLP